MSPNPQPSEEKPIEINLAALKRRKFVLSGTTAVMIVGLLYVAHERLGLHLDAHLITEAEAQTIGEQVRDATKAAGEAAKAAESVGRNLESYVKRQDLKDARERLNVLKQQLGETQLWEATNGANDITRARRADLVGQIATVETYIACLEAGRDDCA